VFGFNACPVEADVVNYETVWDLAVFALPSEAMYEHVLAAYSDCPIPFLVQPTCPQLALPRQFKPRVKCFLRRGVTIPPSERVSVLLISRVVAGAVALGLDLSVTSIYRAGGFPSARALHEVGVAVTIDASVMHLAHALAHGSLLAPIN